MTTTHETALRDLFKAISSPDDWGIHSVYENVLVSHAAELASILAEITGGQYVTPDSGMVVVPAEPTQAMLHAGIARRRDGGCTEEIYEAMLAAHRSATSAGEAK